MEQHGGTVWHNVAQCGGTVCNGMVEQWNSVEEQCGTVWWNSTVKQGNGMVEQCNSMVEQGNSVVEQCGTAWLNRVAECGGTVWNSMVEQ